MLAALYEATDGPNWENDTNWLSEEPLESWYGVSTNPNGQVIELSLHANGLSGGIPPQMGNLSNLRQLWLNENRLNGEIPPQMANLSNLEHIQLSHNQLSGQIPLEFGNLSNLKILGTWCQPIDGEHSAGTGKSL